MSRRCEKKAQAGNTRLIWSVSVALAAVLTACPPPTAADAGEQVDAAAADSALAADHATADAGAIDRATPDAATHDGATSQDAHQMDGATSDGSTAADGSLGEASVAVRDIPASGLVHGVVVDVETNAALAGALIALATTSTTSHDDGSFELTIAPGPVEVTVSRTGFIDWRGELIATEDTFVQTVDLQRRADSVTVAAAGSSLVAGAAALEFPANAFAADTEVRATWTAAESVNAVSGPAVFLDQGSGRMLLGVIDVVAPTQPAQAVTLRLPVPTDATAADLWLYDLDPVSRTWSHPLAPTSVAGGVATFSVDHFSAHGVMRQTQNMYWVSRVQGRVKVVAPAERFLRIGDYLQPDDVVQTERGTWLDLTLFTGDRIKLFPDSMLQIGPTMIEGGHKVHSVELQGPGKVYLDTQLQGVTGTCIHVRTDTGLDVQARCERQNIFLVRNVQCPVAVPYTGVVVEWGQVEASYAGLTTRLDAEPWVSSTWIGAFYCGGCALLPAAEAPSCCSEHNCPTGCCTEYGVCVAGTANGQCGIDGELCKRCGPFLCEAGGVCGHRCTSMGLPLAGCPADEKCIDGLCETCPANPAPCTLGPGNCDGLDCVWSSCGNVCQFSYCGVGATEQCGNGVDEDCDGVVDESGTIYRNGEVRRSEYIDGCVRCTVSDDCPEGNQLQGGQYCPSPWGGYCTDCPPRGCAYCADNSQCSWLEICDEGICKPCRRDCVPDQIYCSGQQCLSVCDGMECRCSAEYGNGCAWGYFNNRP